MTTRIQTQPKGTANPTPPLPLPAASDEFLTKPEIAARLKVTKRTIERWQRRRHLPFLRITGVVRFHWPDVLAHLKKKYQVCHGPVAPGELADAQVVKAETLPGDVTGRLHGPRKAEMGGGR